MRFRKIGPFQFISPDKYAAPFTPGYAGFWTWDRILFTLLVCMIGSFMVLFIGPSSFEHYWHGGSIFFGLFASLMLLMHSQIAWQKRFALGLFCASLVGGLLFFVLIVHESIAAG